MQSIELHLGLDVHKDSITVATRIPKGAALCHSVVAALPRCGLRGLRVRLSSSCSIWLVRANFEKRSQNG
jgi:hypothetical protein